MTDARLPSDLVVRELVELRTRMAAAPMFDDARPFTIGRARQAMQEMAAEARAPDGCLNELVNLGGVPAERLTPANADPTRILIHFHGSAYVAGSARAWRGIVGGLAQAAGVVGIVPDYRLAPECPFPCAIDDAVAVYRQVLDNGIVPEAVIFSGDSAGGGLAVAAALAARDAGLPPAAGVFVISPWTDLTCTGRSYLAKATTDPLVSASMLQIARGAYLAGTDPLAALASPARADLTGLPPMLIHCGSDEILLSDAILLAESAGLANVPVQLEIWAHMIHVWHAMPMAASRQAITTAAVWIRDRLAQSTLDASRHACV